MSISYWDQFEIHSEQSQTKFKLKRANCMSIKRKILFHFHVIYFYILFSMLQNRRLKITEEKGKSLWCSDNEAALC